LAQAVAAALLGLELTLGYRPGWSRDLSFRDALTQSLGRDRDLGSTQVGPQRAELSIRLDGLPAKDRVSRGQQKLLAAVLLIAQLKLLPSDLSTQPTLLLDDPAAELDEDRLATLIGEVRAQPLQLVVTSLHDETGLRAFGTPGRRYRIEQGQVRAG
jgi:DNA replication and repair protein RecF